MIIPIESVTPEGELEFASKVLMGVVEDVCLKTAPCPPRERREQELAAEKAASAALVSAPHEGRESKYSMPSRDELAMFKIWSFPKVHTDLELWRLAKSQFLRVYKVFLQSRSVRPSTAPMEGEFSYLREFSPNERKSQSVENINTRLIIRAASLTAEEIYAYSKSFGEEEEE